jgi:hypothetical protein
LHLPQKGSLSELLLPAGYFQIGRPDAGVLTRFVLT